MKKRGRSLLAGLLCACLCVPMLQGSHWEVKADTTEDVPEQYVRIRCHNTSIPLYMAVDAGSQKQVVAATTEDYGLDNTVWIEEEIEGAEDGNRIVALKNYATQTYLGVENGSLKMVEDGSAEQVKWEVEVKMDDAWEWTGLADFAWNRYKTVTSEESLYLSSEGITSEGEELKLLAADHDGWWSNEWRYEEAAEDSLVTKPGEAASEEEIAAWKASVEEARSLLEKDEEYRTKSMNALKNCVATAEKFFSYHTVSTETVAAQMQELEEAVAGLEKIEDGTLYAPGEMAISGQETIGSPGSYYLDFQEEFDSSTLDSNKWLDEYLPHWTEQEEDSKARYELRDGELVLQIREEDKAWAPTNDGKVICSGISTFNKNYIHNFSGSNILYEHPDSTSTDNNYFNGYTMKYGYIEMRAKMENDGGGGHQALWMVGTQSDADNWSDSAQTAEIDILETSFYDADSNWRICGYGWNDGNFCPSWYTSDSEVPYGDPGKEYHTYGMEWTPTCLNFYYDGELYRTIDASLDYEMGIILSIYQNAGWSGGKPSADNWPKEFNVDYIRVYKPADGYGQTTETAADKNALESMTEMLSKLEGEDFTGTSWDALQEKLNTAKELLLKDNARQEEVDAAYQALVTAFQNLEDGVNKAAASTFLAQADLILENANCYRPDGIEILQDNRNLLKAALEDENISQSELNRLSLKLLNAMISLQDMVDASRLEQIIALAKELLTAEAGYTSDSIITLKSALEKAESVSADENRTQAEVEDAYTTLTDAIAKLKMTGNKSALKPLLDKAEEILSQKKKYTSASLQGLEEELEQARKVYDNPDAQQKEVDEAAVSLARKLSSVRILGDVNQDGSINTADAVILLKVNAELDTLAEDAALAADVNRDGKADTSDVVLIEKYAAELLGSF